MLKMVTKEDRIKIPLYEAFQEKYFLQRQIEHPNDKKTRFIQLSPREKLKFCHEQKKYVEEEYQKVECNLKTKIQKRGR